MAEYNSDDVVIAQERKRVRRVGYFQYAAMLVLVLIAGWAYLPALEPWRLAASPFDDYVMAACVVAILVYGLVFVEWPSVAASSERLIPRQIDGYLTQARRQWLFSLVMLLAPVAGTSRMIATIDEGVRVHRLPADYMTHSGIASPLLVGLVFIGYALSFALPVTWFRRAYNQALQDELVKDLRARAIKIGYIGAVAAMAAGYIVPFLTPIDPLQLMLWLGYAVVALPVLAYVALEAQAGRSD
jgi:hypothetical protein